MITWGEDNVTHAAHGDTPSNEQPWFSLEMGCVIWFTVEYVVRLIASPNKCEYILFVGFHWKWDVLFGSLWNMLFVLLHHPTNVGIILILKELKLSVSVARRGLAPRSVDVLYRKSGQKHLQNYDIY